ncbi:MAG TPA: hypothetical protein VFR99_07020 [Marmoricola sp.]|nr:hypothetical protein [Marmoricola sp.]
MTTTLRRKLALAAGLACLAAPVLSSCGFDYATDRPNVIAEGGYAQGGDGMRVLGSRIVADRDGQGVFVTTIALNPTANAATEAQNAPTLEQVAAGENSTYQLQAKKFSPVAVQSTGAVNMADPSVGGIKVTGDFKAGSIVPVKLSFSDGQSVTVQTPVVAKCGAYASVVPQGGGASAATSATASPEAGSAYDCSFPTVPALGESE